MKKKIIILMLTLLMVISLAACGDTQEPVEPEEPVVEEPEEQTVEALLYFANNQYVETGDEQYDRMLTEKQVLIYNDDMILEETIVRALMKGPEDDENLSTGFPETTQLLGVEVMDGTAFVNFASDGLNGSSTQESYIISQIVQSLGELEYVKRVQFLVDGQIAESLMGHISIEDPIEVNVE